MGGIVVPDRDATGQRRQRGPTAEGGNRLSAGPGGEVIEHFHGPVTGGEEKRVDERGMFGGSDKHLIDDLRGRGSAVAVETQRELRQHHGIFARHPGRQRLQRRRAAGLVEQRFTRAQAGAADLGTGIRERRREIPAGERVQAFEAPQRIDTDPLAGAAAEQLAQARDEIVRPVGLDDLALRLVARPAVGIVEQGHELFG